MNKKLMIAISSAIYCASLGAVASNDILLSKAKDEIKLHSSQSTKTIKSFVRSRLSKKIHVEYGLTGKHTYMVRLKAESVATYKG